jgi:hypothetical protein
LSYKDWDYVKYEANPCDLGLENHSTMFGVEELMFVHFMVVAFVFRRRRVEEEGREGGGSGKRRVGKEKGRGGSRKVEKEGRQGEAL